MRRYRDLQSIGAIIAELRQAHEDAQMLSVVECAYGEQARMTREELVAKYDAAMRERGL